MAIQSPQSEQQIASMFDRIAPKYDFLNRLLSAKQDQRWRRILVEKVLYTPQGRHLDVATGTGDVLKAMAVAHKEFDSLMGVDISSKMLDGAREKLKATLAPQAELKMMSAESLQFHDRSFDSLSIAFGLRNVVNRPKALKEFHRVLKPGGRLLVLEFFPPSGGLLSLGFQCYFNHVLPFIAGLFSDRQAYTYLPQSVGSFYDIKSFRQVLKESGFRVIEVKNFMFGSCRLVVAESVSAI
jgi:demethylmenaquinone methyltransferase/2-methoxy-6-polyprenyl-1,4-benzoquinol methylase